MGRSRPATARSGRSGVQVAAPGRVGRRWTGGRVAQVDGLVVSGLCGGPGQVQ